MIDHQADLVSHHVIITFDLPSWPDIHSLAIQVVHDVIERLEHDGLRPYHTAIQITEQTTT
jgi:hypothetical protein